MPFHCAFLFQCAALACRGETRLPQFAKLFRIRVVGEEKYGVQHRTNTSRAFRLHRLLKK